MSKPCADPPKRAATALRRAPPQFARTSDGDGSEGLWYGRLVIRWPEGSGQETEADRIRIESDAVIECEAMEVSFRGELRDKDGGETLDRMWIVVNSPIAKSEFNDWYDDNADTSWVNTLPKPYAKLQISSSWLWGESATPVNPSNPDPWNSPSKLSGYLHHDSVWEMRAESATSNHGNQACYGANGDIVLSGIGGGTADYAAGNWKYAPSHVREDVNPYLHALHLDGNPGDTGWANGISRPCLYQGDYLDEYIERRPIIHPEGE